MRFRHRPFWAALHEFVRANSISSVIEAGCGTAELSISVPLYTGIDTNAEVLEDNERCYRHGKWINEDFLEMDVSRLSADLFLSASLIEHCRRFEPFLQQVVNLQPKYAVVTFHKGLREVGRIGQRHGFYDNLYSRAEVVSWLAKNAYAHWRIFTLPLSGTWKNRWDSVLVIDWTEHANLTMWEKRHVAG